MTTTTNPPDFSGGPSPRGSILGNAVRRFEDPKILRGEAVYFDDLSPTGLAHLVFVRSTIAHARVTNIDTREAETMPGVVAVYTHENIGLEPNVSFAMLPDSFARPPLANGTVRFVGDMVAAVVAETRAQADLISQFSHQRGDRIQFRRRRPRTDGRSRSCCQWPFC